MKTYSEKVYMYIVYLKSGWVPGLNGTRNSCFRVSQNICKGVIIKGCNIPACAEYQALSVLHRLSECCGVITLWGQRAYHDKH